MRKAVVERYLAKRDWPKARGAWTLSLVAAAYLAVFLGAQPAALAQTVSDGIAAYHQGDYRGARDIWLPLAESGDPVAQFNLGKLYEFGGGDLTKDYSQAARWYREAAAQGIAAAENNLGLMHAQGLGVPRDPLRAAELWKKAAEAGYSLAQYNLALAYFRGEGLVRDERLAAVWFHKSAEAGLADAQHAMAQLIRMGRVMERDDGRALTWYKLAAEQGHAEAALQVEDLEKHGVVAKALSPLGPTITAVPPTLEPAPLESITERPIMPKRPSDDSAGEEATEMAFVPVPPPKPQPPILAEASEEDAAPEEGIRAAVVPVPPPKPEPPILAAQSSQEPDLDVQPAQEQAATAAGSLGSDQSPAAEAAEPGNEPAGQTNQLAAVPEQSAETDTESNDDEPYRIWLFSAYSEAAASELWNRTRSRHARVLASVEVSINEVDFGEQGRFYRVLAGPLKTADAARDICQQLRVEDPYSFCKILAP